MKSENKHADNQNERQMYYKFTKIEFQPTINFVCGSENSIGIRLTFN